MASTPYHIVNLLDKMTSADKDYRFMACNDLMAELKRDVLKLDEDAEKRIATMLLKLLQDKNGEVQNLAVKCLGLLVHKLKEANLFWLTETLCTYLSSKEDQLRDISSIALKTVISELPSVSNSALSGRVAHSLVVKLQELLNNQNTYPHVQLESLDIVGDLLIKYGSLLANLHNDVMETSLSLLKSSRLAVRKRAAQVLSQLATCISYDGFNQLMECMIVRLNKVDSVSNYKTTIQTLGLISRHGGIRLADYLTRVVPLVIVPCNQSSSFQDDELREASLQALEAFLLRCPRDIDQFVPEITTNSLGLLSHDPNYNYDDVGNQGSDDEAMETDQDVGSGDESEYEDYSDDDDVSWKVRRASAKCINAILTSRPDRLTEHYTVISPALIKRFNEREDNVKGDIFDAYIALLKQTRAINLSSAAMNTDISSMETSQGPLVLLQSQVPDLVKAVSKQMKHRSDRTRQGCFSLLTELVLTLPSCLSSSEHLNKIIPALNNALLDKNAASNLKIDTLHFLHILLQNHDPSVFYIHIPQLCPLLVQAIEDQFYKITSEALLVMKQLVLVLRPEPSVIQDFDFTPYILPIYQAALLRLKAIDIDQEVKDRAISCMSQTIATFGDKLSAENLSECNYIFIDRLENEITRLTMVRGVITIAQSSLDIDISLLLENTFPNLASFLRKNSRSLRIATLGCLSSLFLKYSSLIAASQYNHVLKELGPLISEEDLHISQLVMNLLSVLAANIPNSMDEICDTLFPKILNLLCSPLLQGAAQTSTLYFFSSLVKANVPGLGFDELIAKISEPTILISKEQVLHRQGYQSIAKCVSTLIIAVPTKATSTINLLFEVVKDDAATDVRRLFALLAIGEIGKHTNLSSYQGIQDILIQCFNIPSEEIKAAAAFALGNISAGNVEQFVPFHLKNIADHPQHNYLLLQALKEVIVSFSRKPDDFEQLKPCVEIIWTHLFENCETAEEGKRQVVAECLGKLTLIDINDRLPKLETALKSESANVRATVVAAFKHTLTDQPAAYDPLLREYIGAFLGMLEDPQLSVRRVALIALNSAVHNKPALIKDMLGFLLPKLYAETNIRKELIRQVEMGPFKHTVDDGLDMRKAAFECMYTFLDTCLDKLDIFEFLTNVEKGLKDHYDIKMLTYLMLTRLSSLCPSAIISQVEPIVDGLKSTITTSVKSETVKQEYEKQMELKRSAIRALVAIINIPDAMKNPKLSDLVTYIKNDKNLNLTLETIMNDSKIMTNETMETN